MLEFRISFDPDKENWLTINSNDFGISYSSDDCYHGVQCNFEGGTLEYEKVFIIADKIKNNIIELYKLNVEPFLGEKDVPTI